MTTTSFWYKDNNMKTWQHVFFEQLQPGKEVKIFMSGRQVGKSVINQQLQAYKRLMDDIYNRPVEDLILSEQPIHGARYYCVQPVGGSWLEMEAWVRSVCGEPGDMWESNDWCWPETARWLQNNRKFWFRNEADRTMFIMKWR